MKTDKWLELKRLVESELDICKKRGHDITVLEQEWLPCAACGMWVRELRVIEERECEMD